MLTKSHTMHLKGELSPLFSSLVREVHQSPLNAKIPQWLYLANHGHLGNKFWAHLAVCMHASYTLPWAAAISCCQRWGPKQGRSVVLMGVTLLLGKAKGNCPYLCMFSSSFFTFSSSSSDCLLLASSSSAEPAGIPCSSHFSRRAFDCKVKNPKP